MDDLQCFTGLDTTSYTTWTLKVAIVKYSWCLFGRHIPFLSRLLRKLGLILFIWYNECFWWIGLTLIVFLIEETFCCIYCDIIYSFSCMHACVFKCAMACPRRWKGSLWSWFSPSTRWVRWLNSSISLGGNTFTCFVARHFIISLHSLFCLTYYNTLNVERDIIMLLDSFFPCYIFPNSYRSHQGLFFLIAFSSFFLLV